VCVGTLTSEDGSVTATSIPVSGHQDWDPDVEYPARLAGDGHSAAAVGPGQGTWSLSGILLGIAMTILGGGYVGFGLARLDRHLHIRPERIPPRFRLIPLYVGLVFALGAFVMWIIGRTYR
jgi:hypothetical protein